MTVMERGNSCDEEEEEQAEERIVLEESDEKMDRLNFESELVLAEDEECDDRPLGGRRNANESLDMYFD